MDRVDPVDQAVGRASPVRDEQVAEAWHASPAKQALFEEITGVPVRRSRRSRLPRRVAVLLAASLAVAAMGGAAVASGIFDPDPADLAVVHEQGKAAADVHLPGWRPELNAETVDCVFGPGEGDVVRTPAANGPLDKALEAKDLITECSAYTDAGRFDASKAELCTGPSGGDGRSPMPVVLLRGGPCEQAGYRTADTAELLADVNHRREVEIGLLAVVPPDTCVGREEAERRATARVAATGEPLDVPVIEDEGRCWEVDTVIWETDTVLVVPRP
jgi:hypothetical protein